MTCPTNTPVISTIVRHAASSASQPPTATPNPAAPYGPVPRIAIGPRPAGARNIDLTARAMCQCNRDREAVQRYLATHQALAKAIYSGVAHD